MGAKNPPLVEGCEFDDMEAPNRPPGLAVAPNSPPVDAMPPDVVDIVFVDVVLVPNSPDGAEGCAVEGPLEDTLGQRMGPDVYRRSCFRR